MKNLERSEFDEQWKGAFEGAEVPPASSVWSNLDRELTLAEGSEIKKRMIFYQRLAAACLMFALLAGSFGVYHWKQSDKQVAQLKAANDSNDQSRISTNLKEKVGATNNSKSSIENKGNAKNEERIHRTDGNLQRSRESDGNSLGNKELIISNEERTLTNSSMGEKQNKSSGQWYAANLRVPDLMLLPIGAIHGEPTFVEIRRRLPFIPSAFMDKSKKENFNHEKLWASVVAAAGAYSDHNGGSPYSMTNAQSSSSSSAPTGNSYTVGMLGGVRIARRWVLQSGVQYMNQSAGYTSNVSATSLYDLANIAKTPSASLNTSSSSPYNITSTNEFFSLPVQAGYLLIDKKIGWQINPGMAADFFVRNTLADPSGQRQSYSQGAGSDSPYRSVNFAGMMSSEVSYKLAKSYRVSLVPGFRYSFNPALRSQTTGNPFVWDVGFRFRYIFK